VSSFDAYAAYYDLFYRDKDYVGEARYIREVAERAGACIGPRILELGCGTGRHAVEFVREGGVVHGVDLSRSMVEIANGRRAQCAPEIAARLVFEEGDVRTFRAGTRFDTVISMFHVVSYHTSNEDQDAFFETARSHLDSGGVLLFDFWYGPAVLRDPPRAVSRTIDGDGFRAIRHTTSRLLVNANRVDVRFDIEVASTDDHSRMSFVENHRMRYLFLPEIEQRLNAHGFDFVFGFKWLSFEELEEASWNGCVLAVLR
jgi:cyclopropane fatty-acyl-phospholipid synthase-like methyltransferase